MTRAESQESPRGVLIFWIMKKDTIAWAARVNHVWQMEFQGMERWEQKNGSENLHNQRYAANFQGFGQVDSAVGQSRQVANSDSSGPLASPGGGPGHYAKNGHIRQSSDAIRASILRLASELLGFNHSHIFEGIDTCTNQP